MRRTLAENGALLLRVSVSILMLTHGIPKVVRYETLIQTFPDPLNVGSEVSAMLMIFAEVGCSVLLLLGLLGRFAAAVLFIAMMVAAIGYHFDDPWASKELPLLYAAVYASLVFTGAGSTSIDGWFMKKVFAREEPASSGPRRAEPDART